MYIYCMSTCKILAGNHTFASVKGPEDYTFLKACFDPVFFVFEAVRRLRDEEMDYLPPSGECIVL